VYLLNISTQYHKQTRNNLQRKYQHLKIQPECISQTWVKLWSSLSVPQLHNQYNNLLVKIYFLHEILAAWLQFGYYCTKDVIILLSFINIITGTMITIIAVFKNSFHHKNSFTVAQWCCCCCCCCFVVVRPTYSKSLSRVWPYEKFMRYCIVYYRRSRLLAMHAIYVSIDQSSNRQPPT